MTTKKKAAGKGGKDGKDGKGGNAAAPSPTSARGQAVARERGQMASEAHRMIERAQSKIAEGLEGLTTALDTVTSRPAVGAKAIADAQGLFGDGSTYLKAGRLLAESAEGLSVGRSKADKAEDGGQARLEGTH